MAFEKVAYQLYKKSLKAPKSEKIGDDPHDLKLCETINKLTKKPFCYMLTVKIFYNHPVTNADLAAAQEDKAPLSKASLKAEERLKKKRRAKEKVDADLKLKQQWISRMIFSCNVSAEKYIPQLQIHFW